jgi:plastocyanin
MTNTNHNHGSSYRFVALFLLLLFASGLAYVVVKAGTPLAEAANKGTFQRSAAPNVTDVSIVDFAFNPQTISVTTGTTVRWTNTGSAPHTTTSDTGLWDSGTLDNGQQFSFTFNTSGTFTYFCAIHTSMTGTVNVQASPTPTPAATSTPSCPPVTQDNTISNFAFEPQNMTIGQGTTVHWTNQDSVPHTSTSDPSSGEQWDSGTLSQGDSFSHTFDTTGTFTYHCNIHPSMTATINVVTACASTPTPVPSGIISGHVDWQSAQAANRPLITGTLTLCVSGAPEALSFTTNTNGDFTITTGLPDGSYNWMTRGGRHISSANALSTDRVVITGGIATKNFGLQKAGNTNADNIVNSTDFNSLKNQFGQSGQRSADFDYNQVVNSSDFNVLKGNFGVAGQSLTCP